MPLARLRQWNRRLALAIDGRSTGYAASCGIFGGACCVGGAIIMGLGLASATSASAFIDDYNPYFVAASVVALLLGLAWMARRSGFKLRTLGQMALRQGLIMGVIYGATVALVMSIGMLVVG